MKSKHRRQGALRKAPEILNLLITSLTTCLRKAIEQVAKSAEIRQRTTNRDNSGGLR